MAKFCRVKCNENEISAKPFRLKLVVKKTNHGPDDEGAWQSDDAALTVRWDKGDGSPWNAASNNIPRGAAGTNLGAPTNGPGRYRYTLEIRVPGQAPITIDPEVVVSEGSPPGSKRRGAKKKTAKRKTAKKK